MARQNPDDGLVERQFDDLNRNFYHQSPAEYLRHRLRLLALMAGRPDDMFALYEEGIEYGELKMGGRVDVDDERIAGFVAAETEVLWHHAAETLLRAFLAHKDAPPCPWLEIARLRSFATFKNRVRAEVLDLGEDDVALELLAQVFVAPAPLEACERAFATTDVRASLAATSRMLRRIGERYLEHAHAYNAAKHGLAITAGHHDFSITNGDDPPVIREEGPAITYLEVRETEAGPTWHRTTTWILVEQLMGSVFWIALLLESMWSAATMRYVEFREPQVHLPTPEIADGLNLHAKKWLSLPHLPWPLAYWSPMED